MWEIRRGDAEKFIREGGERPVAPGVCDQHLVLVTVTPVPFYAPPEPEATPVPTPEPTPVECWRLDESGEVMFFEDGTPVPCGFEFGIPPEWEPPTEDTDAPVQVP